MNWRIVSTLVVKDLTLYFKNQFFAVVTGLGVIAYIAIFFLMPNQVDENLEIGLVAANVPPIFTEELAAEGLILHQLDSEEELRAAVLAGDFPVGLVLPDNMAAAIASGKKPQVHIFFPADLPPEFQDVYALLIEELAFSLGGQALDINATEEVLGPDMAGQQVPPRQRMLPMLAVMLLFVETLGLASLISMEVEAGTIQALLITPANVEGLFASKGVTGVLLAMVQVVLLVGVTGGLRVQPGLILVALLLGSILSTAVGFLIASVARDLMSVMGWGILAILILAIPSIAILLPGAFSSWIEIIPSYHLVDTVYRVINFDAGWQETSGNLLALLAFDIAFLTLGVLVLRRKYR